MSIGDGSRILTLGQRNIDLVSVITGQTLMSFDRPIDSIYAAIGPDRHTIVLPNENEAYVIKFSDN